MPGHTAALHDILEKGGRCASTEEDIVNLLAHALLSAPDAEIRLGNVLADFVKGRDRRTMSPAFLEGVRQHEAIDVFTDTHQVVSRSKARIKNYRHTTGILVD